MSIGSEIVGSISEYLDRVAQLYTGNDYVLFRGHQCQDWDLTPRLGRLRFRSRFTSLAEVEKETLDEFSRLSLPYLVGREVSSQWDLLALAQHHGLPTRLLDWTTNPLVALWFAIEKPSERDQDAAVWAFEVQKMDYAKDEKSPFDTERTKIFRPRHLDSRIIAQAGWFTVHRFMEKEQRFTAINRQKAHTQCLRKFVIPKQYFSSFRDDLARCGVSKATLFSDLPGLCGYIEWKFFTLADERSYDNCRDI